jgi:transposase
MISMTDPESMTAEERRLEIASILARGVLRRIRLSKTATSSPGERISKSSETGLEVSSRTRLSVAPRPAG